MTIFRRMKSTNKMGIISSILFIILSIISFYQTILHLPVVAATNVLNPGDELNSLDSDSTLMSAGGVFTLGFFTISSTNYTYLGIWYTIHKEEMKVWVANRDIPFIGDDGVLAFDDSGNLKLINKGTGMLSFTVTNDQVGSVNNTRAVLEDSGNFRVYEATSDDGDRTIWQSFDHPTDALLPGMKIGYNLTTKQIWTLTSSANFGVPASGAFTMRLELYQDSPQLLIYQRGELYWASGPWLKNSTFQFLRLMTMNMISDASGMYFTFQTTLSVSSAAQLSPTGQFIDSAISYPPDFCYGYQSDDGCMVCTTLPYCRAQIDSYEWSKGYYITGPNKYDDNSSISLGDCMERCWNDCDCSGCTTNINGTGCMTWTDTQNGFGGSVQAYVLVSSKPPKLVSFKPQKRKKRIWRWILVSVAILVASILTTFLYYVSIRSCLLKAKEKKKRDDYLHQLTGTDSFNYGDELEKGVKDAPDIKIFSLGGILTATNNFSNENKLGHGGYGPVYKGKLLDGREIAVKKLSKTSGQGLEEFRSELILISKLQHTNLVRLYGCCIHQEEKMLIYEFMPNKSLDFFLFADDKKERIDWQIRFNIIEGVAQGLIYLHKYSRMKVIHRDLKVSNVLLDENMNPKIADFGMARIFKQNVIEAVTNRVVGTYGYMAPEYAMEGTFSIKSDVFSFGVLILELVSGKRNSSFYNLDRPLNLVGYAWELWKGQASLELKDKALGESFDVKQLLRTIHVGLLCVQENANDRPTMSELIVILNNENENLPRPKKPAFFIGRQVTRSTDYVLDQNVHVSENSFSITTMEAR